MEKKNVYIGNRYVPLIDGTWDKLKDYEGLTVVQWEGTSYTSKKRVPPGIQINNEEFWTVTGNYNLQVENYRKEVKEMEERVTSEMDYLNNHLNQTLVKTCTHLGMIENKKSEAENNLTKLIEGINKGFNIHVDGVYYLGKTEIDPIVINNPFFSLLGITNNAHFKFDLNKPQRLWDITKCNFVDINGINFTNESENQLTLFYGYDNYGEHYMENFNVEKNIFEGCISLLFYPGSYTNANPSVLNYGIGEFNYSKNRSKNTNYLFIQVRDLPIKVAKINDNDVINFSSTFFYTGVSNTSQYTQEIKDSKVYCEVLNNRVYSEDGYWGKQLQDELYYAFVVAEGQKIKYNNNTVKGLKLDFEMALYDAYLSCDDVEYTGNEWENNIIFVSDKQIFRNTLFKAKGGIGRKVCKNNHFKVTKSFAEKFHKSLDSLVVTLIDITSSTIVPELVIEDNVIDVYSLYMNNTPRDLRSLSFERNTIKTVLLGGGITGTNLINGIDYGDKVISYKDNFIIADDNYQGIKFRLLDMNDETNGKSKLQSINLINNYIKVPSLALFRGAYTNELNINNNTLNDKSGDTTQISIYGNVDSLTSLNNKFISNGIFRENRMGFGGNDIFEDYYIQRGGGWDNTNGLHLNMFKEIDNEYKYLREYEIITKDTAYQFSYEFIYGYDEQGNYVKFLNYDGENVKAYLSNDGNGDNHQNRVELTYEKGNNDMHIEFNNSGNPHFRPINVPNSFIYIRVKTNSFKLD